MKTRSLHFPHRGSALISVLIFSLIALTIAGSMLSYSVHERRANYRHAALLEARNTAESASELVIAQVKSRLKVRSNFTPTSFISGPDAVTSPSADYLRGSDIQVSGVEVLAGLMDMGGQQGLVYLDPTTPEYANSDYAGLNALIRRVPVYAKATATRGPMSVTAYSSQNVRAYIIPLFTFAAFYNMDFEVFPGPNMTINGPVHGNRNMYIRKQSSAGRSLEFLSRVSCVGGIYSNKDNQKLGLYYGRNGTQDTTDYTDNVYFTHSTTNVKTGLRTSTGVWRDYWYGMGAESDTSRGKFKTFVDSSYGTNVRTGLHGIEPLTPPGFEDDPATPEDESLDGRPLIEQPKATDSDVIKTQKISRNAGIYIVVNPYPTDKTAVKPDGTAVTVKAHQYRVFSGTGGEILLPGQRFYGESGTQITDTDFPGFGLPEDYTGTQKPSANKWEQYANAVVRFYCNDSTPAKNMFIDLRRVKNFTNYTRSSSNPHTPRPILKIDIDMTNLKKAVDYSVNNVTQSTVYDTGVPTTSNWTNSIYNPSASPVTKTLTTKNAVYSVATKLPVTNGSFWNGAVYVYSVDAEVRTFSSGNPNDDYTRPDTGVRLVNGRGRIASKGDQGLTFATNDALYIVGHYNADGRITTGATDTSSRYPEAGEAPTAIMADAITVLSHPTYQNSSGNIKQVSGWNDGWSGLAIDDYSSWITGWASTSPSNSNAIDGSKTTTAPYALPLDADYVNAAITASSNDHKFYAADTEISAAFMTGLSPSVPSQRTYSGGLHNFPRFLEDWFGQGSTAVATCAIRGSMVAMFKSKVGEEPWSLRIYQAPTRLWGLHQNFIDGKLPPFTPNVVAIEQLNYRDIGKAEYDAAKADIQSL